MCCVFVCVFHLIEAEANNEADDVGDDDDDGKGCHHHQPPMTC